MGQLLFCPVSIAASTNRQRPRQSPPIKRYVCIVSMKVVFCLSFFRTMVYFNFKLSMYRCTAPELVLIFQRVLWTVNFIIKHSNSKCNNELIKNNYYKRKGSTSILPTCIQFRACRTIMNYHYKQSKKLEHTFIPKGLFLFMSFVKSP